jgi:hypothetical protein
MVVNLQSVLSATLRSRRSQAGVCHDFGFVLPKLKNDCIFAIPQPQRVAVDTGTGSGMAKERLDVRNHARIWICMSSVNRRIALPRSAFPSFIAGARLTCPQIIFGFGIGVLRGHPHSESRGVKESGYEQSFMSIRTTAARTRSSRSIVSRACSGPIESGGFSWGYGWESLSALIRFPEAGDAEGLFCGHA